MRTEKPCRSCGLRVITDDVALVTMHEVPECAWFSALVARVRAEHGARTVDSVVMPLEDVDAYLDKLARKRKAGAS